MQVDLVKTLNAETKFGRTPLQLATENRHVMTVRVLIKEFSANANVKTKDGQTLLHETNVLI